VVVLFFNGEFDPGSGRTLAARFMHASRTDLSVKLHEETEERTGVPTCRGEGEGIGDRLE